MTTVLRCGVDGKRRQFFECQTNADSVSHSSLHRACAVTDHRCKSGGANENMRKFVKFLDG